MTKHIWRYQGDISLEYGGTFFDFSEWRYGYVSAVNVTDLDSAMGFNGAVLIEERTIPIDNKEHWPRALSVVGASLLPNDDIDDNGRTYRKDTLAWRMCLAYALSAYGEYETDRSTIVQPRMTCLDALDGGLFGVESISVGDEYADYLNTGETYAATVIYWRGNYRVQSIGDFVETLERNGTRVD